MSAPGADRSSGGGAGAPGSVGPRWIRIGHEARIDDALRAAGIRSPRPTIVLIGGAGKLSAAAAARIAPFVRGALVPVVERMGGAVVDGGTDAGIMRLIGRARRAADADFPLVGVVAEGTIGWAAERRSGVARLEPNHSVTFVVPGANWGDESPWLLQVASALAGDRRPVTVVVNGGAITLDEALQSAARGFPVVAVAGSGRTADLLARALDGAADDLQVADLVRRDALRAADVGTDAAGFERVLAEWLDRPGAA
jgi:hypothetical protein